ncbi:MAG: ECF-type sigma factor [Acidobacteriota bacterium]
MTQDVTDLLLAWNDGHKEALDELLPLVAGELRQLAAAHLRNERSARTLQPTALVNELYLRLVDRRRVTWKNRSHFFGFAATTLRRILVDHARAKHREKRGGGAQCVTLEDAGLIAQPRDIDVLALDQALEQLAALEPRLERIVELRFFAGLTIEEVAEVLGIGSATVVRDWKAAQAFLLHRLESSAMTPEDAA